MEKIQGQHRHGDVALIPTNAEPPADAKRVTRLVLAEGEVTGHAHVLTGEMLAWDIAGQRHVKVIGPAILSHEEHGVQVITPLPAGSHEIRIKREWDLSEEWKPVVD